MTFHLFFLQYDKFFFIIFFYFRGILILYEYTGRSMPVFYTSYTIFIGVIGRRDFTIICPILPKSYRDSADFLPCDFLTALLVGLRATVGKIRQYRTFYAKTKIQRQEKCQSFLHFAIFPRTHCHIYHTSTPFNSFRRKINQKQ